MRKPVYAICEQQRHRSVCASAQSDQRLCRRFQDSIIPLLAIAGISRLWLVSVAEQVGLSLNWSQTPKTEFLVTWLKSNHKPFANILGHKRFGSLNSVKSLPSST